MLNLNHYVNIKCGPARLVMWDIHALQERFYFDNHVIPIFRTATPLLIQKLKELNDPDVKPRLVKNNIQISIAFPDEGALKRFGKEYKEANFDLVVCTKVREGDKRIITIKEGDVSGRHVVIVDDLVKTGKLKSFLLMCRRYFD